MEYGRSIHHNVLVNNKMCDNYENINLKEKSKPMNQWNNLKTHLIFTMIESWLFKNFDVFFHFPSNITVPLKSFPFVGKKLKGDREWENKMYSKSNEHFDTLVYHMSNCQRI